MKTESLAMCLFRSIGLESIAWSLRRLLCLVDKNVLVLEVDQAVTITCANVLLDVCKATRERHCVPLEVDRLLELGFAERLPFKDNAFDFVIAAMIVRPSIRCGRGYR